MLPIKSGILDGAKGNPGSACALAWAEAVSCPAVPSVSYEPLRHTVRWPGHDACPSLSAFQERLRELAPRLRIAVIYGGDKEQPGAVLHRAGNTRPWKSYREVAANIQETLRELGFEHVWLVPENMDLPAFLHRERIGFAWLNTGGVQGDNPVCHAVSLLEMLGVPYVGHPPFLAALLDEKDAFKRQLQAMGFPTATFTTWHPSAGPLAAKVRRTFGHYTGPFIVKPVSGRASLHVHKVANAAEAAPLAAEITALTHRPVVIERFLPGREFCVGVCGQVVCRGGRLEQLDEPFAFSPLERKLLPGEDVFTSMDKKAITEDRAMLLPMDDPVREELCDLARQIYREMDLKTLVRLDVRADETGRLCVLEANPKPDLKKPSENSTSLVSIGLPEQGMNYHDLIYGLLADRLHDLLITNPKRLAHLPALVG
jgi:D-alanine-D-alanine ligase